MAPTNNNIVTIEGLTLKDVIPDRGRPWWRDRMLLRLNFLLVSALFTQVAQGFDASMINGIQSLPQWTAFFGHPTGTRLGAMTFGPTGGVLISTLVSAKMCDKLGRRWPIFLGSIIVVIGSVLQAASQNYGMFVAGRFIIGFGMGIVMVAAPPMLSEIAYPSQRGIVVSFYAVSWPIGSLIAAWTTYGSFQIHSSWSWRLPSALQGVFSIIQALLIFFAPESPRWLIYQGRDAEALTIFAKHHADGDVNAPLVQFEMAEVAATLAAEKEQEKGRWREWIRTSSMRHRFFIVCYVPAMLQWSGNGLTSYYLTKVLNSIGITNSKTQLIINGCLSIWSVLVAVVFASLADLAGRRRLFMLAAGGMLLSYIIWTVCSALNQERHFQDKGLAGGVLAMIFVFGAAYHFSSPVAPTYVMEVAPYSLRSKASMIYQLNGNLATLYNSFANPVAMDAIQWKYYIVWCAALAVHLVVIYFFFPETKGRGLEEVAEILMGLMPLRRRQQ